MTASTKNTIWTVAGALVVVGLIYYFWPKAPTAPSTSSGRYIPNTGGGYSSPDVVTAITKQDADRVCMGRGYQQSVEHTTLLADGSTSTYYTCTYEPSRLYTQFPLVFNNVAPTIHTGIPKGAPSNGFKG